MTVAVSLNVFPAAACIALTLMVMLGCTALVTFPRFTVTVPLLLGKGAWIVPWLVVALRKTVSVGSASETVTPVAVFLLRLVTVIKYVKL